MAIEEKRFKKNGGFKFKISVVMAVYNVSPYIDEAISSVLNQTIGFEENIQLILSDDGSTDNSGEICDKYKKMYPNNVVVIHKKNGGPGSARNAALPYIEGRYVNFMDPDDTISKNTFKGAYRFFKKHEKKTDYVSFPMYFFEGMHGPHHLNNKFKGRSRVINLMKDHTALQYSEASALLKNEVAKNQHFNEDLVVAEDAQQIIRILMNKPFLGVYKKGRYNYRKRNNSLIGTGGMKKGWYIDYLTKFSYDAYNHALEKFGYVPKFVQNTIMGDLRWKFSITTLPTALTEEETKEYLDLLYGITDKIDEDIIANQSNFLDELKSHIIARRYENYRHVTEDNIIYGGKDFKLTLKDNIFQISHTDIRGEEIVIGVRVMLLPYDKDNLQDCYLTVGNEKFEGKFIGQDVKRHCIGTPVSYWSAFEFTLPKKLVLRKKAIYGYAKVDGITVKSKGLFPGYGIPATNFFHFACAYKNGIMIRLKKDKLLIYKSCILEKWIRECFYRVELLFSSRIGAKKAFFARTYAGLKKLKMKKPLWIITDRLNKAGDNGEVFFEYLISSGFDKADFVFGIGKCDDYKRLKAKYGDKVILYGTNEYKLTFLNADKIISSQGENYITDPFDGYTDPYRDITRTKDFIFLQHGIIKDDLSSWLNRFNKSITGFICSAKGEYDSIVNGNYLIPEKNVWLTGLCRYDKLYNDEKKYITVMPTWRKYLMGSLDLNTGTWTLGRGFCESAFFKFYNALLNDERVLSCAQRLGYTLCFMPHPNSSSCIDLFDKDPRVKYFDVNTPYNKIFAESNLVLTDYSSAIFDFAYMRKPVFYAQFDKEEFSNGEHCYVPGYFDYERDGLGEVVYNIEDCVKLLCDYMENDCKLKDKYKERIDSFYAFNDKNNCKRILDKILELK